MDSSRERRLFAWFDGFAISTVVIDVVLLIPLYVLIHVSKPAQGTAAAMRELALGILLNLIPVLLVAVGSYLLLRKYQGLRLELQNEELADQVQAALSPQISRVTEDVVAALSPELSSLAATVAARRLPTTGVELGIPEGKLMLISARYYTERAGVDVTEILASKVSGERLELSERYSSVLPDPEKHEHKKLTVVYLYAGTEISITVPEDTPLVLPLPLSRSARQVEAPSKSTTPRMVLLRAYNGRYVFTLGGQGAPAEVVTKDRVEAIDALEWIERERSSVALRTRSEYYLCAEGGGGGQLLANRHIADPGRWETFTVVDMHDNRFAFRTFSGQYLRVHDDDRGMVTADGPGILEEEIFERFESPAAQ